MDEEVEITVNAKNVDVDPNGDCMTVTLTGVPVSEIVAELTPSDILACLDKSDVMEYYKDDSDQE
jgi:hypothetical protein